jgi:hypothetical protein
MAIDSLYRDYFQKSKVFLYPLLGIKRGSSAVPIQTYLSWEGYLKTEDIKLICVYETRTDVEYLLFEKNTLIKNPRLTDYIKLEDNKTLFTFDFSDLKDDWDNIASGRYSKISKEVKYKLLNHFDKYSGNRTYLETYLFPEKYFTLYADLLNVNESLLKDVGELCSPPDLEKETLTTQVLDLQNKKILG